MNSKYFFILPTIVLIILIEIIFTFGNTTIWPHLKIPSWNLTLQGGPLIRITLLSFFLIFLYFLQFKKTISTQVSRQILATAFLTQSIVYAMLFVWGPNRWQLETNFKQPSMVMAHVGEFAEPSSELINSLHSKLNPEGYRTSFICNHNYVRVNCSSRIAINLKLRTLDGYLNSVPNRLSILELNTRIRERINKSSLTSSISSVTYDNITDVDLALLGLFNTKYILYFHPALFTNSVKDNQGKFVEVKVEDFKIIENPYLVSPRVFFTNSTTSTKTTEQALRVLEKEFRSTNSGFNSIKQSVIEGDLPKQKYKTDGEISAIYKNSEVILKFSPLSEKRFLVLNERYTKDWRAYDNNGNTLNVYPTNVFMRGVVVEPGINSISFQYEPFLVSSLAFYYYISGLFVFIFGLFLVKRLRST